jgi:hypothetical protein
MDEQGANPWTICGGEGLGLQRDGFADTAGKSKSEVI